MNTLSENQVKTMLRKNDFFDFYWNKTGKGFQHQFEARTIKDEKVVIDHASGLVWQQGGSSEYIDYETVKIYVDELNNREFAGFNDWRLPTLEEAMGLMESKRNKDGLYIDPIFDAAQGWIWTSNLYQGESRAAWVVYFTKGYCYWNNFYSHHYVRVVRSGQSSIG